VAPAALASHEDGFYELPAWDMWDTPSLNVLVVPPAHGPIFGSQGFIENGDPAELTPFNTYLKAVEDSIAAWNWGVSRFGSSQLQDAFHISVYVVGRDTIPPAALTAPDIIITTTDDTPLGLGSATRPYPCVVNNSDLYGIANYADIYNINGQEYGHCLGVNHVGDQGGFEPTAALQHPEHDIMNGFYTHDVGDDQTHLHCISNLDVLALEYVFAHKNGIIPIWDRMSSTSSMPVSDYRTICDPAFGDPPARPWQPDPEASPAPSSDAEVEPASRITRPTDGTSMPRSQFDLIEGATEQTATNTEIALARMNGQTCLWWQGDGKRFSEGACDDPTWIQVADDPNWSFAIKHTFARGHYELRSRAVDDRTAYAEDTWDRGRNLVQLRLR